jgi:pimeloyl-ACP methyl ester carboxylesterase
MFMSIQSFTIAIPQATLDDLRERLARTQTIYSSMRNYYKDLSMPQPLSPGQRINIPAGFARFPKDLPPGVTLPRELAERHLRIERWTQMPRGGHFAALEEPELLVEDLRAFFRPFRT